MDKKRVFERKYKKILFLIYFSLVVPVSIVSIFSVNQVSEESKRLEENAVIEQLEEVCLKLYGEYKDYYEQAYLIAKEPVLQKNKISEFTYDGIQFLEWYKKMDIHIKDVFAYYGSEYVYASSGMSRKSTYVESVLNCKAEYIDKGYKMLETKEPVVGVLNQSDYVGNVVYIYPIKINNEIVHIGYVIDFEEIRKNFGSFRKNQMYFIEDFHGDILRLGYTDSGKNSVLNKAYVESCFEKNVYKEIYKDNIATGLKVKLHYMELPYNLQEGFNRILTIHILLIIIGILISTIMSYVYSVKQVNSILTLERLSKGDKKEKAISQGIYSHLYGNIKKNIDEFNVEREALHIELKNNEIEKIFYGLYNGAEDIKKAFHRIRITCPQHWFFVGYIGINGNVEKLKIPKVLEECLHFQKKSGVNDKIIFLMDLKEESYHFHRAKFAKLLRDEIHLQGINTVYIGMSQIYDELDMIAEAFKEAKCIFDRIEMGMIQDYYGCWDIIMKNEVIPLPDKGTFLSFGAKIEQCDIDGTFELLTDMLCRMNSDSYSEMNKCYVRYYIMCYVADWLAQSDLEEREALLKECINLNISSEKGFEKKIKQILKKALTQEKEDSFIAIIKYIEDNYSRSDLTYEDVATVGGISKTYVSKLFRTKTGKSYIEYLTEVRLEKACALLRTTKLGINEISQMVGYENASAFRRNFKEYYGINATEYRRKEQSVKKDEIE